MSIKIALEELSKLNPVTSNKLEYIYHYVHGIENLNLVKEIGICSPRYLKKHYPDIFMKTSFKTYEERTKSALHKKEITPDDIILFLDKYAPRSKYINSKGLFFLFLPILNYNEDIQKEFDIKNIIECKIPITVLKKYKPITFFGSKVTPTTWNKLTSKSYFKNVILRDMKSHIGPYTFSKIEHVAFEINNIPANKMIINTY